MKVLEGRWLALESSHEESRIHWQEIQINTVTRQPGWNSISKWQGKRSVTRKPVYLIQRGISFLQWNSRDYVLYSHFYVVWPRKKVFKPKSLTWKKKTKNKTHKGLLVKKFIKKTNQFISTPCLANCMNQMFNWYTLQTFKRVKKYNLLSLSSSYSLWKWPHL